MRTSPPHSNPAAFACSKCSAFNYSLHGSGSGFVQRMCIHACTCQDGERPHYSIRLILIPLYLPQEFVLSGLPSGGCEGCYMGCFRATKPSAAERAQSRWAGHPAPSPSPSLEILCARRPTGREARERSCFGDSAPLFPFRAFVVLVLFSCEVNGQTLTPADSEDKNLGSGCVRKEPRASNLETRICRTSGWTGARARVAGRVRNFSGRAPRPGTWQAFQGFVILIRVVCRELACCAKRASGRSMRHVGTHVADRLCAIVRRANDATEYLERDWQLGGFVGACCRTR